LNIIKYIGFYPKDRDGLTRHGSIAAANKMDYICDALNGLDIKVEIISPSWYTDNRKASGKYTICESKTKTITFFGSFSCKNRSARRIRALFSMAWLFFYLLTKTRRGESIVVYHALLLIKPIQWVKKLKKLNLILEVNEIYSEVRNFPKAIQVQEFKMFSLADKYIFSTELLNEKLNKSIKPYVINSGTYRSEKERNSKFDDGKIHVVYAGIIDNQKGSGTAVKLARYLDSSYHVHIIGFGTESDIKELENLINQISTATTCRVTYDGLKQGEDYIEFLQKCHIGLSTQSLVASYNETSFPSKILSYLSNGLRVVSIRLKAIEDSEFGELIYFYDLDTPEEVAKVIKKVNFSDQYDSRKKIEEVNKNFILELAKLLK